MANATKDSKMTEQTNETKAATAVAPANQLEELIKLVSSGNATALDMMKLSELLANTAAAGAEEEKASKIALIDNFINEQGLTYEEYVKMKKPAPSTEVIWEWTDPKGIVHKKIKGTKGKWASKDTVKNTITLAVALEHAKNAEGKEFIKKVYAPK